MTSTRDRSSSCKQGYIHHESSGCLSRAHVEVERRQLLQKRKLLGSRTLRCGVSCAPVCEKLEEKNRDADRTTMAKMNEATDIVRRSNGNSSAAHPTPVQHRTHVCSEREVAHCAAPHPRAPARGSAGLGRCPNFEPRVQRRPPLPKWQDLASLQSAN